MAWMDQCLQRSRTAAGDLVVRLGVPQLDGYLEFLAVRSRPNTVVAVAYDLKVFFTVVGKPPRRVVAADVLAFVVADRGGLDAHAIPLIIGHIRGGADMDVMVWCPGQERGRRQAQDRATPADAGQGGEFADRDRVDVGVAAEPGDTQPGVV